MKRLQGFETLWARNVIYQDDRIALSDLVASRPELHALGHQTAAHDDLVVEGLLIAWRVQYLYLAVDLVNGHLLGVDVFNRGDVSVSRPTVEKVKCDRGFANA